MKFATLTALGLVQAHPDYIEQNMHISDKEFAHSHGVGNYLMQLSTAAVGYIEKTLHDFNNIQIYSNIYFGSDKQEFPLIFDTGSSWVWIGTDMCDNCVNPKEFNVADSTTFRYTSERQTSLYYGRGAVTGYDSTDQVCLTKDSVLGNGCMSNYRFKSIIH